MLGNGTEINEGQPCMDLVISSLHVFTLGLLGVWFVLSIHRSWYPGSRGVQLRGCGEGPGCENLQEGHQLPVLQRLDLCLWTPESDIKGDPGQLMGSGWFWIWDFFGYRPALGQSRALLNSMH